MVIGQCEETVFRKVLVHDADVVVFTAGLETSLRYVNCYRL